MNAGDTVPGQPLPTAYVDGRLLKRSTGAPGLRQWWASRGAAIGAWALAGWPVWRWFAARIGDGSDEPWGLVALAVALAFVPWRRLREPLSAGATAVAAGAVLTEVLGYDMLPPIVRGALWMFTLAALLSGTGPAVARTGLLLLSLPVVATAQFYLGYPLRALTAACSVPLLHGLGYGVVRQGTALRWAGETVLVDAPCSGIQMAWTGLFAACVLATLHGLGGWATLRLLRQAAMVVAAANLLRCVALFLVEVRNGPPAPWLHEGIGLACFGGALGVVAWLARRNSPANRAKGREPNGPELAGATRGKEGVWGPGGEGSLWRLLRYSDRGRRSGGVVALFERARFDWMQADAPAGLGHRWRLLRAGMATPADGTERRLIVGLTAFDRRRVAKLMIPLLGLLLVGAAVRPLGTVTPEVADRTSAFPGWPETFDGRALVPVAASEREARFAAGFPGRVAAFTDGDRAVVIRWVARETRKLHPALHCLRGLGYAAQPGPVWRDGGGQCWGTTVAERGGRKLRVRERITDGSQGEWTDVSAWWWDAWRGSSVGPWWAVTVFEG